MSWNSRSRLNFAHALNKFTHTNIHTEVVTVFPTPSGRTPWSVELFLEVPGYGLSSLSIQWDGTWLRTDFLGVVLTKSGGDCQMSWSISPWSPSWVKTAQRVGLLGQRRTWNTIAVPCPPLPSPVPPHSNAAQPPASASRGQLVGISLGPPNVVAI
jgi:hypothetical protein